MLIFSNKLFKFFPKNAPKTHCGGDFEKIYFFRIFQNWDFFGHFSDKQEPNL